MLEARFVLVHPVLLKLIEALLLYIAGFQDAWPHVFKPNGPARFNEWSQAVWQSQKNALSGASSTWQWRFMGIVVDLPDVPLRDQLAQKLPAAVSGAMLTD